MSRTRRLDRYTERKTLRDGKAGDWNWSTPSWWINMHATRAQRQATRRAELQVLRRPDARDGLIWPLARKPHRYFW